MTKATRDGEKPSATVPWFLIATGIIALAVIAYVVGYIYGSDTIHVPRTMRSFTSPRVAKMYVPAAWIESRVTGRNIWLIGGKREYTNVFFNESENYFFYSADPSTYVP